jgi:hypothetical protein
VEPLEAAVPIGGGLAELAVHRSDDLPTDRARFVERVHRGWQRAKTQGWVSVWAADEICVKVLGVHPAVVFGDAWWQVMEDIDVYNGVTDDPGSEAGPVAAHSDDARGHLAAVRCPEQRSA